MGLLSSLLTLPVSGPVNGVAWVARQVADVAEERLAESDAARELAELERAHMFGEVSEEEHRRREAALWERLRAARTAQEGGGNGH